MNESEKYKASIEVKKIATKEDAKKYNIKIGEEFIFKPEPKNKEEVKERFEKLQAQRIFEAYQRRFKRKYGSNCTKKVIQDELDTLNKFIDESNQLSTNKTFENKYEGSKYDRDLHEYSRLTNGFYDNPDKPFSIYNYYNNNAADVYAKYVLYKKWLEKKLSSFKHKRLIDKDFLEDIRTLYGIMRWQFDEEEQIEIVPESLTHHHLLRNNPIGDNIKKFYYYPTSRYFTDEDFEKMKRSGYLGMKDETLAPYPFIIYGAFFHRIELHTKLSFISFREVKPYLDGNNALNYFDDFRPYFKEYASGFEEGYNNFEKININPYLTEFADKQDFIYKVHEFITKKIIFEHDWLHHQSGFTIANAGSEEGGKIIKAFEDGQKQGYYYKAWTIIFSNSHLFEPLFIKTVSERINNKPLKKDKEVEEKVKSKKNRLWFKAGVLFADGTMDKYWNDNKNSYNLDYTAPIIASEVSLPRAEKYILASFQGYENDKNIFRNRDKMMLIINHLKQNGKKVSELFLDKLPPKTT